MLQCDKKTVKDGLVLTRISGELTKDAKIFKYYPTEIGRPKSSQFFGSDGSDGGLVVLLIYVLLK